MYTEEIKRSADEIQNQIMKGLPENARYQIVFGDKCRRFTIYCDSLVLYRSNEIVLGMFETNTPRPENWITEVNVEDIEWINIVDKYNDSILKTAFRAHEREYIRESE